MSGFLPDNDVIGGNTGVLEEKLVLNEKFGPVYHCLSL